MKVGTYKNIFNKNWPWIVAILVYNLIATCIYAHFNTEDTAIGETALQMTNALSRMGEGLFSKDYVFHDMRAHGFYSPQQILTLKYLYLLFKDFTVPLALMNFVYGVPMALVMYWFLKRVGYEPWKCFLLSFLLCAFVYDPMLGNYWGLYRFNSFKFYLPCLPYMAYMPLNWSLADSFYLFLLYLLLIRLDTDLHYCIFSFVAGLLFVVHVPTGMTFMAGASILYLWKAIPMGRHGIAFIIKNCACFLLGASPFFINYILYAPPHSLQLTAAQEQFLYNFWQYRYPDDYPRPIWKLLIRGFPSIGWTAHLPPIFLTLLALWAWKRDAFRAQVAFIYGVICYVFVFKAIPYALFGIWMLYSVPEAELGRWRMPLKRLFLITFGTFLVTTWGQLAMDTYYNLAQKPPFIVDNTRFMPFMGANAFMVTAILFYYFLKVNAAVRSRAVAVSCALIAATLVFSLLPSASILRSWAERHHVLYRAQYDPDPHFRVSDKELSDIVSFGWGSPLDSLFIFLDSDDRCWEFRFRSRRSIGMNFSDMGAKYYMLKNELVDDWAVFEKILGTYRTADTGEALNIARNLGADYLIFPKTPENERLALQAGISYVIIPVSGHGRGR